MRSQLSPFAIALTKAIKEQTVTITNNSQSASVMVCAGTPLVEATPPVQQETSAPLSMGIGRAYERFLEMPGAFVLAALWVAGAALLGWCALVLYIAASVLVQTVAELL